MVRRRAPIGSLSSIDERAMRDFFGYKPPPLAQVRYVSPDSPRESRVDSTGVVDATELDELLLRASEFSGRMPWPLESLDLSAISREPQPPTAIPKPEAPECPERPTDPPAPIKPKLQDVVERVRLIDFVLLVPAVLKGERAQRRLAEATSAWEASMNQWRAEKASRWEAYYANEKAYKDEVALAALALEKWKRATEENQRAYESAHSAWKAVHDEYVSAVAADRPRLLALKAAYETGQPTAIEAVCLAALARAPYPTAFPNSVEVRYSEEGRVLCVDYLLPNLSELNIKRRPKGDRFGPMTGVPQRELKRLQNFVPYAVAIRSLVAAAQADESGHGDAIVFNGMLRFVDPPTGQIRTECILSVMASRDQLSQIEISRVDPLECFRALKGMAAPSLADRVPVPPILRISRDDRRIIAPQDVIAGLDASANIAAMPWEEFEHLVRQLLEREFARDGVEVKVTQASRDKGVDALAFDPDPLRGGKFVIQAKRYTRVVDVSAVRDLYGTIHNEGANRGILVTTSSFGRDSYDFAKDKPISLIDGSNLLHLLRKHGFTYRIDLVEARRLNLENQ